MDHDIVLVQGLTRTRRMLRRWKLTLEEDFPHASGVARWWTMLVQGSHNRMQTRLSEWKSAETLGLCDSVHSGIVLAYGSLAYHSLKHHSNKLKVRTIRSR